MSNETEQLTAQTTFYALTASLPGYTLEDQVLGSLTLREWLLKYDYCQDGEENIMRLMATHGRNFFFRREGAELQQRTYSRWSTDIVEITPAELLNRLRLDAMDEEGYIR